MSTDERPPRYPVLLDLKGRLAVVVGSGKAIERIVRSLAVHGADIVVISPAITPLLIELEADGLVSTEARSYVRGDLEGAFIAFCDSGSDEIDGAVRAEAESRRVLLGVLPNADESDFVVPSVVRRGELQLAISTGGVAPALSRQVRRDLAGRYGAEWGPYVELVRDVRILAIERTGLGDAALAPLFEAIAASDVLARLAAGETIGAEEIYEQHASSLPEPAEPEEELS